MLARIVLALGICAANALDQYPGFPMGQFHKNNKYNHPLITPDVQRLFETPIKGEKPETPPEDQRPREGKADAESKPKAEAESRPKAAAASKPKANPWMQQEMKNPWMQNGNAWAAYGGRPWTRTFGIQKSTVQPTMKPTVDEESVAKPEEKSTCTFREREVLKPVMRLSTRISGSVSSNGTVKPQLRPKECLGAVPMPRLRACFFAAGFTKPTADCWAQEQFNMKTSCGGVCHKDPEMMMNYDMTAPGAYNMMAPGMPFYQLAEFMKGISQVAEAMKSAKADEGAASEADEKVTNLASAGGKGMWGALSDMVTDTLLKGFDRGQPDNAVGEVRKMVAKIPAKDLQSVIWSADTNGDGKVTTAEMAAAIQEADDTMVIDPFTGKFVEKSPGLMQKKALRQPKPTFVTQLTHKLGRLMKFMGSKAAPHTMTARVGDLESLEDEGPDAEGCYHKEAGTWCPDAEGVWYCKENCPAEKEEEEGKPAAPKKMQFPDFRAAVAAAAAAAGAAASKAPAVPAWATMLNPSFGQNPSAKGGWTQHAAPHVAADPPAPDQEGAKAGQEEERQAPSAEPVPVPSDPAPVDGSTAAMPVAHSPGQGMGSFACQHCMARLRQLRRTCVNEAMKISEDCQSCQIQASKFYDATCMMPCVNVFYKTEHQQKECRLCTDQYNEMMAQCGL